METDGKRLLLAVAVAMGVMLMWNMLFPPQQEPKKEESATEDSAKEVDAKAEAGGDKPTSPNVAEVEASAETEATPKGPEQFFDLEFDEVNARFSSYGGVLSSWTLESERYKEKKGQLDLVKTTAEEGLPFAVNFEGSTFTLPADAEWQGERIGADQVVFRWSSPELRVEKRFTVVPDQYLIRTEIEFKNLSGKKAQQALHLMTTTYQDPKADTGGGMGRMKLEWQSACFIGGELEVEGQEEIHKKTREWSGAMAWAGATHPYFLAAMAPKIGDDSTFTCRAEPAPGRKGAMLQTIEFPVISLAPGDPSYTWTVSAFFGPKYLDKLDRVDQTVGYKTQLREAVDLGWFALIARPMLVVLKWFYSFVGNWGIAIILLTLMVKLLLLPWTHKSMKSMKKMSVLAPRMKEIQKKYKDDKAMQQQAIMSLYKQEGVNPLSGCLPMLLQMPIWIALYRMLMYAAELYRAPFIPGWINDMTAPDPFHVMPVLLVIVMFVQAKFTPATGDGMQQKMLKYGMPLMFGGMSFMFPAGLTLYIFTNTCLTGVHHVLLRRGDSTPKKGAKDSAKNKTTVDDEPQPAPASEPAVEASSGTSSQASSGKTGGKKKSKKKKKKGKRK